MWIYHGIVICKIALVLQHFWWKKIWKKKTQNQVKKSSTLTHLGRLSSSCLFVKIIFGRGAHAATLVGREDGDGDFPPSLLTKEGTPMVGALCWCLLWNFFFLLTLSSFAMSFIICSKSEKRRKKKSKNENKKKNKFFLTNFFVCLNNHARRERYCRQKKEWVKKKYCLQGR